MQLWSSGRFDGLPVEISFSLVNALLYSPLISLSKPKDSRIIKWEKCIFYGHNNIPFGYLNLLKHSVSDSLIKLCCTLEIYIPFMYFGTQTHKPNTYKKRSPYFGFFNIFKLNFEDINGYEKQSKSLKSKT